MSQRLQELRAELKRRREKQAACDCECHKFIQPAPPRYDEVFFRGLAELDAS